MHIDVLPRNGAFRESEREDFPPHADIPRLGGHDDFCGVPIELFAEVRFVEGDFPVCFSCAAESDYFHIGVIWCCRRF